MNEILVSEVCDVNSLQTNFDEPKKHGRLLVRHLDHIWRKHTSKGSKRKGEDDSQNYVECQPAKCNCLTAPRFSPPSIPNDHSGTSRVNVLKRKSPSPTVVSVRLSAASELLLSSTRVDAVVASTSREKIIEIVPNMRANIFLLIGGSFFGIMAGLFIGRGVLRAVHPQPASSEFSSLSDLRNQMDRRGATDVRADGSVSFRSIVQPHPQDDIIYTLRPNLDVKFEGVSVKTNSHGMRGPETTLEKPPGVYRVALLGDSFAFGWGVEEDQIFARVLERKLQEIAPTGTRVEVLNFGVPGYSTFQEAASFLNRGKDFNPDAVLVYFVNNDYGLPFFIRDVGQEDGTLANVKNYVGRVWKTDDPKVLEQKRLFWRILDPNRGLRSLEEYTKPRKIPLFVAINPGKSAKKDSERLYMLRHRKSVFKVGLDQPFKKLMEERGLTSEMLSLPTDPHPNSQKHTILGELLAAGMRSKLFPDPAATVR